MSNKFTILDSITEVVDTDDETDLDKLYIEITYYPDHMPQIKSYYKLTKDEYKEITTMYMDLYIDNFINGEKITKDNLDIHIINNPLNIEKCKNFIETFGNPFDILLYINERKIRSFTAKTKKEDGIHSESDSECEVFKNLTLNDNQYISKSNFSDSDSDEYISTLTEIIGTYNKTKTVNINNEDIEKYNKDDVIKEIIEDV
jgi:hypothetical protein